MISKERFDLWSRYTVGFCLVLACTIGGATGQGVFAETLLKLVVTVVAGLILTSPNREAIPTSLLVGSIISIALVILQLVPLPMGLFDQLQPIASKVPTAWEAYSWRPLSLTPGRTLEVLTFVAPLVLMSCAIASLNWRSVEGLIPFVLIGASINIVVALTQFGLSATEVSGEWMGYSVSAGMFANPNHFSSLMYVSIVLATVYFIRNSRLAFLFAYLLFCLLALFAAGSRAGIGIGIGVVLVCFAAGLSLIWMRGRRVPGSVLSACLIVGSALFLLASQFFSIETGDLTRLVIWDQTRAALFANGVVGTGFGSFVYVFQSYEQLATVNHDYINHAHNDFLELILEGGLPALCALLSIFGLLVVSMFRKGGEPLAAFSLVAFVSCLIHSVVDYPLRTFALALIACLLLAIIAKPKASARQ